MSNSSMPTKLTITSTIKLKNTGATPATRQGGVALFFSLVILLLVTLLGVASVQTTSMEERMSRNSRDVNIALLAAESAIKDAETQIETLGDAQAAAEADAAVNGTPVPAVLADYVAAGANNNGFYVEADFDVASNSSTVDWDAPGGSYKVAPTVISGVAAQPKYIIEYVKTVNVAERDRLNINNVGQSVITGQTQIFRITAISSGGSVDATAMIQSTYGRPLD
jgi:type IV pilus assembly protein PilX